MHVWRIKWRSRRNTLREVRRGWRRGEGNTRKREEEEGKGRKAGRKKNMPPVKTTGTGAIWGATGGCLVQDRGSHGPPGWPSEPWYPSQPAVLWPGQVPWSHGHSLSLALRPRGCQRPSCSPARGQVSSWGGKQAAEAAGWGLWVRSLAARLPEPGKPGQGGEEPLARPGSRILSFLMARPCWGNGRGRAASSREWELALARASCWLPSG